MNRKTSWFVGGVLFLLTFGSLVVYAGKPQPQPGSTTYKFVGYTTSEVAMNIGYVGMAQACEANFGLGARIATTKEVIESPNIFGPAGSYAVVQVIPLTTSVDYSGIGLVSPGTMNCNGFQSTAPNLTPFAIDPTTLMFKQDSGQYCSNNYRVACSAPL